MCQGLCCNGQRWGIGGEAHGCLAGVVLPSTALLLSFPRPTTDDNLFYFWSNRTYYDAVSGEPKYTTTLVARK